MRAEFMDDEAMRRTTVAVQMPEDRRRISLYRVVSLHSAQVCRSGWLKESECCSLRTAIRQTDQHQRTARILPQGGHSTKKRQYFLRPERQQLLVESVPLGVWWFVHSRPVQPRSLKRP